MNSGPGNLMSSIRALGPGVAIGLTFDTQLDVKLKLIASWGQGK